MRVVATPFANGQVEYVAHKDECKAYVVSTHTKQNVRLHPKVVLLDAVADPAGRAVVLNGVGRMRRSFLDACKEHGCRVYMVDTGWPTLCGRTVIPKEEFL